MTKRFRIVAGPNGSGKSTLAAWLMRDYAVNFYTMLNADDVYALVRRTGAFFTPFPIDGETLAAYALRTEYAETEKRRFRSGRRLRLASARREGSCAMRARGVCEAEGGRELQGYLRGKVAQRRTERQRIGIHSPAEVRNGRVVWA